MMARKIPEEFHGIIVGAYCKPPFMAMIDLAKTYSVSRQAIWKILKDAGVDTLKSHRVERTCGWCGKAVLRVKSHVRGRKRVFCRDSDCYFDWMRAGGNSGQSSPAQRVARSVVSKHFTLEDIMVVHQEDGNTTNNMPSNLKVFADHNDHMRYHFQRHSGENLTVPVLWDGSGL